MKNIIKSSGLIFFLCYIISCTAPLSKKSYLEKFDEFDAKVSQEYKSYDSIAWEKADKRYEKLSDTWNNKYKEDLTTKEKLKITSLRIKYNTYKASYTIDKTFNNFFKEDVDQMKKEIKFYIENNMNEDIDKLLKSAQEIGDSTYKSIEQIINQLKNEIQ